MHFDSPDLLYQLLPEEYRTRDAAEGYPLRALLAVIGREVQLTKADIDQLYANLFIETAAPWAIPYLGDLVGTTPLAGDPRRSRADVARTISYRRRKGTRAMLQEMATAVTGWPAQAVDLFHQLGWTQHLEHQRPAALRTPDLRQLGALGPTAGLTADLRPATEPVTRPNLHGVAFYLWRLGAYPVERATPLPADAPGCYWFSPLGLDGPLFHLPQVEAGDPLLAVPDRIQPIAFRGALESYYGPGRSFAIEVDGALVPVSAIVAKDLSAWSPPPAGKVAVDLTRGRLCFPPDQLPAALSVSYTYGFSADLGGGPYLRPTTALDDLPMTLAVSGGGNALQVALTAAQSGGGVIEIQDSATYTGSLALTPPAEGQVVIRAAAGQRPVIRPDGTSRNLQIQGDRPKAAVHLIGLCLDGGITVDEGLGYLTINHCTLVPRKRPDASPDADEIAYPSLYAVSPKAGDLRIQIDHSITGPLKVTEKIISLAVSDSIIDGLGALAILGAFSHLYGPAAKLTHVTALGRIKVREIDANGLISSGPVTVQRQSVGGMRYSALTADSLTPARYQCCEQVPPFTSIRYGDPAYGQLSRNCPSAIRTGAEDGAEMGAFHGLEQPQREQNLRTRLLEYLPVGREPAMIYVT